MPKHSTLPSLSDGPSRCDHALWPGSGLSTHPLSKEPAPPFYPNPPNPLHCPPPPPLQARSWRSPPAAPSARAWPPACGPTPCRTASPKTAPGGCRAAQRRQRATAEPACSQGVGTCPAMAATPCCHHAVLHPHHNPPSLVHPLPAGLPPPRPATRTSATRGCGRCHVSLLPPLLRPCRRSLARIGAKCLRSRRVRGCKFGSAGFPLDPLILPTRLPTSIRNKDASCCAFLQCGT
jgi:hypothetical protein